MSSTTVGYRGRAFEAADATIEVWLALMVDEIDALKDAPEWLRATRDEWAELATAHFGFGVMPDLDRHLADDARRELVLGLARRASERLQAQGDPVPAGWLNGLRDWGAGYVFRGAAPASTFRRPAHYFIKLLEGTLAPEEGDARFAPGG